MLKKYLFSLLFILPFIFVNKVCAFKADTFVTIANPVRGLENWSNIHQTPLDLPKLQYIESTPSAVPVTWLLRYDAVDDATISAYFQKLTATDHQQSLGAFLEITPRLANASHVPYPEGLSFSNADRIFLSGYSPANREKIIDTFMATFFTRFGFYPQSVFAGDLDSNSLQYIQTKYSVLTAMNYEDQYAGNHYRLWGGYLGSPYFPDRNNSLIPARSFNTRINLAMVRWAPLDLFNFYGTSEASKGSISIDDLLRVYGQREFNEFTHINIGIENDRSLSQYKDEIRSMYQVIKKSQDKYNLHPISLSGFGDWLKGRYPESSPAYYYQSVDPKNLVSGHVYWYQSPFYRLGLKSENGQTKIVDFRVYNRYFYEDNFSTPNQNIDLIREIPAVIDTVKYPGTEVVLDIDLESSRTVHSKQLDLWQIAFTSGNKTIVLAPDKIIFSGFSVPPIKSLDLKVTSSGSRTTWNTSPHQPLHSSSPILWIIGGLISALVVLFLLKKKRKNNPKGLLIILIGIFFSLVAGLTVFRSGLTYPFGLGFWGPNGHDAIFHLSLIEKFSSDPFSLNHPQLSFFKLSNYHFLFDYLSGLLVKIFGVTPLSLYFQIFPVIVSFFLVILLNTTMNIWRYSPEEKLVGFIMVFFAGSFGFIPKILTGQDVFAGESAFWSNQSISLFLNPPFALSLVILLSFLIYYSRLSEDHNSNVPEDKQVPATSSLRGSMLTWQSIKIKDLVFLSLLGGLLAQTKVYIFVLLLLALLVKRQFKIFIGVVLVGILISLPFTTFQGGSPFAFSPLWFPHSLFASYDRFYWPKLVSAWQAYEASGNWLKLISLNLFATIVFLVGNLGVRIIGLIDLHDKRVRNISYSLVEAIIWLGLILPLVFVQKINPWNTIQFMYYSLFLLGLVTAKTICSLGVKSVNSTVVIPAQAGIHKLLRFSFIVVLLFLATATSIGTIKDYFGFYSAARVSFAEISALETLRQQPTGTVLSPLFDSKSASHIATPKPLYAYVSTAYISALSGQPEYLADTINLDITGFNYTERARLVQRFYNTSDKEWAISFLKNNQIVYVYETPLQKIRLNPSDIQLRRIFDSGEVNVYKFN